MCGITGILALEPFNPAFIDYMTEAVAHRGPDARGIFINEDRTLALGHTRLSIIDLRAEANQPFYSQNERYVVVFNGEIYNFLELREKLMAERSMTFKTTSDTEVIAEGFAVWGEGIAEKLEGMFSIAIADRNTGKVFLLRDRIGKKPLFYFRSESLFAFASEIKSFLQHPIIRKQISLNRKSIPSFLHVGYIPEPETIFNNIYKFPAGNWGTLDKDLNFEVKSYWKIEDYVNPVAKNGEQARSQLKSLLVNAVQQRLVSDVPIGSFLSGGTDSSLITAIAAQEISGSLKTFNIGFKDSKFDEAPFARAVSKHLGTDHTEYQLEEKEAINILETYINHFDEPFADTSAIPTMLVSQVARRQVKVVLTGDGGDELFQGYGAYRWAGRLDTTAWKIMKQPLRAVLRASGKSRLQRVAHMLEPIEGSIRSHIFSQEQYFFSQAELYRDVLKNPIGRTVFEYDDPVYEAMQLPASEKQALFDFKHYLKDDLLVKVDRASMYYALECRSPLLDHRVIEYAFSLNHVLKVHRGQQKWLLKELLRSYLPPHLINRPKWGFSIPLVSWLKNDLRYLIDDFANDNVLEEAGIVNVAFVSDLRKQFLSGKDYLYNRLWLIIVLHKWWKDNSEVVLEG